MSWTDASAWLGIAGAAVGLAIGLRWALRPEQVAADARSGASDPRTVRRFGLVMVALCAIVLPLMLMERLGVRL